MITESDWKTFKKIKEKALEKFCAAVISDCEVAIAGKDASHYESYLALYRMVEKYDKKLGNIFDGLSRSSAYLQLMVMRSEGLVEDADLLSLSEEAKQLTKPDRF
ncbi:MAG: hypothetical protein KAU21_08950, partial [Gammaproteobacteria bacterium]|nr:hypothetical protein [Gammaproteobacteria bacterium]